MITAVTPSALVFPIGLTPVRFQTLAEGAPEIEWFANLKEARRD